MKQPSKYPPKQTFAKYF